MQETKIVCDRTRDDAGNCIWKVIGPTHMERGRAALSQEYWLEACFLEPLSAILFVPSSIHYNPDTKRCITPRFCTLISHLSSCSALLFSRDKMQWLKAVRCVILTGQQKCKESVEGTARRGKIPPQILTVDLVWATSPQTMCVTETDAALCWMSFPHYGSNTRDGLVCMCVCVLLCKGCNAWLIFTFSLWSVFQSVKPKKGHDSELHASLTTDFVFFLFFF